MDDRFEGEIRVGPAGWSYEDWKGIVYPPDMPRSLHPLKFLCGFFDLIEVNSTFYRPANPVHTEGWLRQVRDNPRFTFAVKLWQRFTHQRDAWPGPSEIMAFRYGVAPLADAGKLGALLVQFPWSFRRTPENRTWLARVLDTFSAYPLAVELRHSSWERDEVYAGLEKRGAALCNIDQPLFDDSIAPGDRVTAPFGYVRFHGRNYENWFREDAGRDARYNYLYSEEELQPWIERIKAMKKRVNDLFIVTNNHYRGQAVVNALEIQAALGRGAAVTLPAHLIQEYPRLKGLLRREG
jgi:uncharacterized protein YecE (DUF72 family)